MQGQFSGDEIDAEMKSIFAGLSILTNGVLFVDRIYFIFRAHARAIEKKLQAEEMSPVRRQCR